MTDEREEEEGYTYNGVLTTDLLAVLVCLREAMGVEAVQLGIDTEGILKVCTADGDGLLQFRDILPSELDMDLADVMDDVMRDLEVLQSGQTNEYLH